MTPPGGKEAPASSADEKAHAKTPAPSAEGSGRAKGLEERLKALEDERDRLKKEVEDVRDKFLRSRADYENLVRRVGKDTADSVRAVKGALLLKFIGVLETLEKAQLELEKASPAQAKGLKMVLDEKRRLLKDEGVKEIDSLHQLFNYRYHQAVETVETVQEKEGTVVEVVQRGYLVGGEILRPALVKVAAPPKLTAKDAGKEAAGQKA